MYDDFVPSQPFETLQIFFILMFDSFINLTEAFGIAVGHYRLQIKQRSLVLIHQEFASSRVLPKDLSYSRVIRNDDCKSLVRELLAQQRERL